MKATRFVALAAVALVAGACGKIGIDRRDEHGMTALMYAAQRGDRAEVDRLIARGANVNATVPTRDLREFIAFISWMQQLPSSDIGYRALHYAAAGRHPDIARQLMERGAEVNHAARGGTRALDLSIFRSDTATMAVLVGAGARVEARQLWSAVSQASPATVAFLLAHGANPNAEPPVGARGRTAPFPPLAIVAAQRGDTQVLALVIGAGVDVNARDRNGWTALRHASQLSRQQRRPTSERIVALLEASGASDETGRRSDSLFAAINRSDSVAARRALAAGADANAPDDHGVPPLLHAARRGQDDVVAALVAAGANVNFVRQSGDTPLTAAIEHGSMDVVTRLLAAGARVDLRDGLRRTPLQVASGWQRTEITALLLKTSAPVDSSALPIAALNGTVEQVRLLLAAGARPNAGNGHALSEATRGCYRRDNTEVIRVLLEAGADPKIHGEYSPLHRAVSLCDTIVVRMFLARGVDPNAHDLNNVTPIMGAAFAGRLDAVRMLIAARADVNARDRDGKSVLQYAARHPEVQAELRRAGAR